MNTQERKKNQLQRLYAEGLIAEHWGIFDLADMMGQVSQGGRR